MSEPILFYRQQIDARFQSIFVATSTPHSPGLSMEVLDVEEHQGEHKKLMATVQGDGIGETKILFDFTNKQTSVRLQDLQPTQSLEAHKRLARALDHSTMDQSKNAETLLRVLAQRLGFPTSIENPAEDIASADSALFITPDGTGITVRHDIHDGFILSGINRDENPDAIDTWNDIRAEYAYQLTPNRAIIDAYQTLRDIRAAGLELRVDSLKFSDEKNTIDATVDIAFGPTSSPSIATVKFPWHNFRKGAFEINALSGIITSENKAAIRQAWIGAHEEPAEACKLLKATLKTANVPAGEVIAHHTMVGDIKAVTRIHGEGNVSLQFIGGKPTMSFDHVELNTQRKLQNAFGKTFTARYENNIHFESHTRALYMLLANESPKLSYSIRDGRIIAPTDVLENARIGAHNGDPAAQEFLTVFNHATDMAALRNQTKTLSGPQKP